MKRTIVAVSLLLVVGLSTGCNAPQQTQQAAQPSPETQAAASYQANPLVVFKTDPDNKLPTYTPSGLAYSLYERHGLDKFRRKPIRIIGKIDDVDWTKFYISFTGYPRPELRDVLDDRFNVHTVLGSLKKGDYVEIVGTFSGLSRAEKNQTSGAEQN